MNMNERKQLGKTDLYVSPVAYGGIISMDVPQEESDKFVSYAIDRGVNYFDVAPTYGNAQEKLGKSIIPYRNRINLACKTGHRTYKEAKEEFYESLKMLNTDYFDVFQLHALIEQKDLDLAFSDDGVMRFLVEAKKEGLIRNIGFSSHNDEIAVKATTMYDFETTLFPMNWGMNLSKGFGNKILKVANDKNMGKLALKTLAYRKWENNEQNSYSKCWYKPIDINDPLALAAMKYTMSLGVDVIVPPGYFEYFKYVLDNLEFCNNNPLNDDDIKLLNKSLEQIQENLLF